MDAFDQLLAEAGPVCAQERRRDRLHSHLLAQWVCLGEHTLTGLLSTTGQPFRDGSAAYRLYGRNRVDPSRLLDAVRRAAEESLPEGHPLVVALDDSILRKRGHKIPATAWRPDPLGAPFQVNFVWAHTRYG
ncbi:MAG: transposase [Kiritimatiellae bacterium]|nr:transposase [Kiritimatiellia bacterium]